MTNDNERALIGHEKNSTYERARKSIFVDYGLSFGNVVRRLRLIVLVRSAKQTLWTFTPDLLRHYIFHKKLDLPSRPQIWIDGLRGCAALMVFNFHFFDAFSENVVIGYGHDANHKSLLSLPLPRLLCHGGVAVCLFFIPAGYVCSTKPVRLMTENKSEKLMHSLARSVFRRTLRLYLPVACMSLITALAAYVGLFEYSRPLFDDRKHSFPGHLSEAQLAQYPTLKAQLTFWLQELWELLNVFKPGPFYPAHDNHLWSVQYEFRGIMHLYIALVGLARVRPWIRIACLVLISAVYLSWDRWEGPLFFLGATMAQLDVLRSLQGSTLLVSRHYPSTSSWKATCMRYTRLLCYALCFYLMSYPIANYKFPAPGYRWVNELIPSFYTRKEKFPASIGSLLFFFLMCISGSRAASTTPNLIHHALTSQPARYLGHNMFAIYLVHGPLLHLVGYAIPHIVWRVVPRYSDIGFITGVTTGWLGGMYQANLLSQMSLTDMGIALMLTLLTADFFTREIDARCARFIEWLEHKISVNIDDR